MKIVVTLALLLTCVGCSLGNQSEPPCPVPPQVEPVAPAPPLPPCPKPEPSTPGCGEEEADPFVWCPPRQEPPAPQRGEPSDIWTVCPVPKQWRLAASAALLFLLTLWAAFRPRKSD